MALFRSPGPGEAGTIRSGLLAIADAAAVGLTGIAAFWLVEHHLALPRHMVAAIALGAILVIAAEWVLALDGRDPPRGSRNEALRLAARWILAVLVLASLAYLTRTADLFPRSWSLAWFFGALALLLLIHALAGGIRAATGGRPARRIAIVGAGEKGSRLVWYLQSLPPGEVTVVGIYDDRTSRAPSDIAGVPVIGNVEALTEAARDNAPDVVIVALPGDATARLNEVLRALDGFPADIKFCPDSIGAELPMLGLDYIGSLGLLNVAKPRIAR
jgi:FlaA1/EpsC-like NDP-sugar epimerase